MIAIEIRADHRFATMKTQSDMGETEGAPRAAPGSGDPFFAMREPPGRLGAIVRRLKQMAPAPPPFPAPDFAKPASSEAE